MSYYYGITSELSLDIYPHLPPQTKKAPTIMTNPAVISRRPETKSEKFLFFPYLLDIGREYIREYLVGTWLKSLE